MVAIADAISELLYSIAGILLLCLGGAFVVGGLATALAEPSVGSVVFATIALVLAIVFVSFGALVTPEIRSRLDRRHGATRFGRVRSVDHRVMRGAEGRTERCVRCDERISESLVRRYREEYAIAGVPIYATATGYNHYCVDCAVDEVFGGTDAPEPTRSDRRDPELEDDRDEPSLDPDLDEA